MPPCGSSSTPPPSACCCSWSGTSCPRPGNRSTRAGAVHEGTGGLGAGRRLRPLFAGGLAVGLCSAWSPTKRWMRRPRPAYPRRPGAMTVGELTARRTRRVVSPPGNSRCSSRSGSACTTSPRDSRSASPPRRGEIALATLLVIGFALHNATEGFGIVAPLAAEDATAAGPSWAFLWPSASSAAARPSSAPRSATGSPASRSASPSSPSPPARSSTSSPSCSASPRRRGARTWSPTACSRPAGRLRHRRDRHGRRRLTYGPVGD